jgi:hypothetical protein
MRDQLNDVGVAAARLFTVRPYVEVSFEEIAAAIPAEEGGPGRRSAKPGPRGRSTMWLYGVVQTKGQTAALGLAVLWSGRATTFAAAAGKPATLAEGRAALTGALIGVGEFVEEHRFLCEQVIAGLADLPHRRNAQPRAWPDTPLGRVAAAAREGRCEVFAEWLLPFVTAAHAMATAPDPVLCRRASAELSDLMFRFLVHSPGPTPPSGDLGRHSHENLRSVAAGAAAFWAERHLFQPIGTPGALVLHRLDAAERAVTELHVPAAAGRALRAAQAREAMATGRCYRRAMTEYRDVARAFEEAGEWADSSDSLSRLALSALRWGTCASPPTPTCGHGR